MLKKSTYSWRARTRVAYTRQLGTYSSPRERERMEGWKDEKREREREREREKESLSSRKRNFIRPLNCAPHASAIQYLGLMERSGARVMLYIYYTKVAATDRARLACLPIYHFLLASYVFFTPPALLLHPIRVPSFFLSLSLTLCWVKVMYTPIAGLAYKGSTSARILAAFR